MLHVKILNMPKLKDMDESQLLNEYCYAHQQKMLELENENFLLKRGVLPQEIPLGAQTCNGKYPLHSRISLATCQSAISSQKDTEWNT